MLAKGLPPGDSNDKYDDDSNNDVNDGNNDVDNGDGNFDDGDDDLDDSNHCWLTARCKCLLDSPIPDNILACEQVDNIDTHMMMMMTTMMQSTAGMNTLLDTVGPVIYLQRECLK